jgi:hypothetical protein
VMRVMNDDTLHSRLLRFEGFSAKQTGVFAKRRARRDLKIDAVEK